MTAPSIFLGFLGRTLASIVIVAMLLLFVGPASDMISTAASGLWRWPEVKELLKQAKQAADTNADEADLRLDDLRGRPAIEIESRLRTIDLELKSLTDKPKLNSTSYMDLARLLGQGNLEAALRNEIQHRLLQEERGLLRHLLSLSGALAGTRFHARRMEALKKEWAEAQRQEVEARERVRRLEAQAFCRLPASKCAEELSKSLVELKTFNKKAWDAHDEWKRSDKALREARPAGQIVPLQIDRSRVNPVLDELFREVDRVASWQLTTARPIWNALIGALQIVAAALTLSIALKAFFFFVLARMAEKQPAVVVCDGSAPDMVSTATGSALSVQLSLAPGQELDVAGSHLQSVEDGTLTSTRWLFSAAHPLTSIFSGLWMLTRLRSRSPCEVVLSATTDALEELAVVDLQEGDALVLLPKHLVGVIHPSDRQVRLQGYWKFGIQSWLTLQFRYLVLTGPCSLIVGGCRGVRVEPTNSGKAINQAMTVGFSSRLAYSVSRTETFWAYLIGQRPLFNDRFKGPGVVLYQEVPSTAQRTGFTGRGLQGVIDGAMKAFGL